MHLHAGRAPTDVGATALGGGLAKNKALLSLGLARNKITSEGGTCIAKSLQSNLTLRKLDLSDQALRGARHPQQGSRGGEGEKLARVYRHNTRSCCTTDARVLPPEAGLRKPR